MSVNKPNATQPIYIEIAHYINIMIFLLILLLNSHTQTIKSCTN